MQKIKSSGSDASSNGSPLTKPWRRRKVQSKSHTGCLTCKSRKIKCDESKPVCHRCRSSRRSCSYVGLRALAFDIYNDQREARGFHYFLHKAAFTTALAIYSSACFFTEIAPRMSHQYPAIRHLLVALASLQESIAQRSTGQRSRSGADRTLTYALEQYASAVRQLSHSEETDIPLEAVLAACVLFAAFDTFQNSADLVCSHVLQGLKIWRQHRDSRRAPTADELSIARCLRWFAIDSCAFKSSFPGAERCLDDGFMTHRGLGIPSVFITVYEAYECMDTLIKCIAIASQPPLNPNQRVALEEIEDLLLRYQLSLETSAQAARQTFDGNMLTGVQELKIHHRVASVMAKTLSATDETPYDDFTEDFEYIVSESQRLLKEGTPKSLFSLHLGIIPPLFFTGVHCREPSIRRRAICTLHSAQRRERTWDSCLAARVAERVMQIEELNYSGDSGEICVPAHCRISLVKAVPDMSVNATEDSGCWRTEINFRRYPWKLMTPIETDRSICWNKDYGLEDRVPQTTSIKVFRASGYAGSLLTCRPISCRCPVK